VLTHGGFNPPKKKSPKSKQTNVAPLMKAKEKAKEPWRRNKPLAKNALPAAVVPRRDRAKGNREERGGHHAAIWTIFQLSYRGN